MMAGRKTVLSLFTAVVLVFVAPFAAAQKRNRLDCNATPDEAVQCFVRNAVQAGLTTLPEGMTMAEYRMYGVSVSRIVQTPGTLVFVLGAMGAVSDALPPTQADGRPDPAPQEQAIGAILDSALRAGLITLPPNSTPSQLKRFAQTVAETMGQNSGLAVSPGAFLRLLDSYLVQATSAGTVDWNRVRTQTDSLVDGLVKGRLLHLPQGVSSSNAKQFAYELARAVQDYKRATGRSTL